jgi:outer membrane protein
MKQWVTLCAMVLAAPLWAQTPLSLGEAVRMAVQKHPAVEATAARLRAADARIEQARSGRLPRVNYQESWMRSDNPVFVFGSLLTQHQFTERNFDVRFLNRPDFLNNFQSTLIVDQPVYDARQTKSMTAAANLGKNIAAEDDRLTKQNLIANVVRSYFGAVLAAEALKVATEAVKSAEADLQRAEAIRAAGMATDADVLSIKVHLAAVREQQIKRADELEVARAALNEAIGLPLDTRHELTTPLTPPAARDLEAVAEKIALDQRPEVRQLKLAAQVAETQIQAAKGAMLPQVFVRAGFEADRQEFIRKGGANWMFGAMLRWNLFNGNADKQRIAEANQNLTAAQAQLRQMQSGVQLQVRSAKSNLDAARQRVQVAQAAVAMAEESLRITKNRYEAGLATVTDLLRTEIALLETKMRVLAAVYDERLAATAVSLAAGALTPESEVLK